ncbi:MAG: ribonuclease P Rpr2/Rpp21/SNM1 subunit [Sulfolobales archaeon]
MRRRRYILRDLVIQRSLILLDLAFKWLSEDRVDLSRNAIRHIENLRRETNVRIPFHLRRFYCRKCFTPLIPGRTSRVRIKNSGKHLVRIVTCLSCGYVYRLELERDSRFKTS